MKVSIDFLCFCSTLYGEPFSASMCVGDAKRKTYLLGKSN